MAAARAIPLYAHEPHVSGGPSSAPASEQDEGTEEDERGVARYPWRGPPEPPTAAAPQRIWSCKIGECESVPQQADLPMRAAVTEAYRKLTGTDPLFVFSGWGAQLDEFERDALLQAGVSSVAQAERSDEARETGAHDNDVIGPFPTVEELFDHMKSDQRADVAARKAADESKALAGRAAMLGAPTQPAQDVDALIRRLRERAVYWRKQGASTSAAEDEEAAAALTALQSQVASLTAERGEQANAILRLHNAVAHAGDAMESASVTHTPSKAGYAAKRKAVLDYVAGLEAKLAQRSTTEPMAIASSGGTDEDAERWRMHLRLVHKKHGARVTRELVDVVNRAIAEAAIANGNRMERP